MALSVRVAARSSLFRQYRALTCPSTRTFSSRTTTTQCLAARTLAQVGNNSKNFARLFSSSIIRPNQSAQAPNAKAYIESGVVKGGANPVDVKRVLVIGSGGLSIGQAGEFDYSGLCFSHALRTGGVTQIGARSLIGRG
jgi:carbamoyl-phosphate synthase large subunit